MKQTIEQTTHHITKTQLIKVYSNTKILTHHFQQDLLLNYVKKITR